MFIRYHAWSTFRAIPPLSLAPGLWTKGYSCPALPSLNTSLGAKTFASSKLIYLQQLYDYCSL